MRLPTLKMINIIKYILGGVGRTSLFTLRHPSSGYWGRMKLIQLLLNISVIHCGMMSYSGHNSKMRFGEIQANLNKIVTFCPYMRVLEFCLIKKKSMIFPHPLALYIFQYSKLYTCIKTHILLRLVRFFFRLAASFI